MNFIVFDLELNQDFSSLDKMLNQKRPALFEIIQIGAVKLNSEYHVIDTFNRYVKPSVYGRINPFITELTGITTEQLSSEETFPEILDKFLAFIGNTDCVFCVWGTSDITELFRNVQFHNMSIKPLPRKYINIQPYVSLYFHFPAKNLLRLEHAVQALNIPIENAFHNAFYDAGYTAEIFKKIYNSFIEAKTYDPSGWANKPPREPKRFIDTEGLLKQFEKMYNKELSEEEKSIILLAYKMGKTGQFLKPTIS